MESITVQLKLLFVAGPAYRIVGEAGQMSRYDSGQETERLLYRFFLLWNRMKRHNDRREAECG